MRLDPWQQMDLIDAMGEGADWKCPVCTYRAPEQVSCPDHPGAGLIHPWAAFEVVEVDPRQNGKSEMEIVRELAGALILEEPLQIYSAHQFDTAIEIFLRLETVVLNSDDLRAEVKMRGRKMVGIKHSHGEEGIEFRNGCRIRFKARTGSGGRGFSCDRLALDEGMILPEAFLGPTLPTLSAIPNPQLWIYGSAPDEDDPSHDGIVLAKRRERALAAGDKSLAYFERSADWAGDPSRVPDSILDDPEQWIRANPGVGYRISLEYIASERRAMGARQFAVERLGITKWPSTTGSDDRVISREAFAAIAEHDSANRIVGKRVFVIDANPIQTRYAIATAGKRDDGRVQFALHDYKSGDEWLVDRCVELKRLFPGCRFAMLKNGPANEKLDDLRAAHVRVDEIETADYAKACGGFFAGVMNGRFRYPSPQPELDEAISAAQKGAGEENAWTWSRKRSTGDICPLVAVTVAAFLAENMKRARVVNLNNV